jgi:hypothetical protein
MAFRLGFSGGVAPKPTSIGSGRSLARGFPTLFAFLLLVGFVVQGTAVQTHLHFSKQDSSVVSSSDRYVQFEKPGKDDPASCPLCQEAAMAGAYMLPSVAVLPPPPAAVLWIAVTPLAAFGLLTPAHSWQSRAPPQ